MKATPLRFVDVNKTQFSLTLRKKVDEYFRVNNLSKTGNGSIVFKMFSMVALFFVPYALIMTNSLNIWVMWLMAALMGTGMAGIGMTFMHDANHGSFFKNQTMNQFVGYVINLVGGNAFTWKVQHNYLHHSFTNIEGMDEDIRSRMLLRFSPQGKHYKIHHFQHIYAFLLYGLMTFSWVVDKDYKQLINYHRQDLITRNQSTFGKELTILIVTKLFYYFYAIVLPLVFLDITWWQFIIGFMTLHFFAGFILAIIFQMAHVVEKVAFPEPDEQGVIANDWSAHQLATTSNFARNSKFLSWYCGGLNYQVEHHLFPRISHIHYPKISQIVQDTAREFGVAYNEYPTFGEAIVSHVRTLRRLGQNVNVA